MRTNEHQFQSGRTYSGRFKGDAMTPEKTGRLVEIGTRQLGLNGIYTYSRCVDCGAEYPHLRIVPICNGHQIRLCPWCRPDSAPWTAGRGI